MIRRSSLAALACTLALIAAGCGGNSPDGGGGEPGGSKNYATGGTLNYRLNADWSDFQVQKTTAVVSLTVLANNYATLLAQDKSGKLQPYLAEKWTTTPTSVEFVIKDGITCEDGQALKASGVAASLQRMIDTVAPYNRVLFGPGPYKVTADDAARTVKFEVGTPYSALQFGFGERYPASMTGIICPAGLAPGADLVNKMYGAGPYKLVSARHGDQIVMELRDDFAWGPDGITAKTPGLAKQLVYKVVANDTTATNLLTTGGLDVAQISGPDVTRLRNDPTVANLGDTSYVASSVVFNETPGHPTTDQALRQAMITAVDPQAWATSVSQGQSPAAFNMFSEAVECYDPSTKDLNPAPSVDAAKKVLEQADYTGVGSKLMKDGQPVKIRFSSSVHMNPGPEYVATQWRALGIDVDSQNLDQQRWGVNNLEGNFDAAILESGSPGPTPGMVGSRFMGPLPPAGSNFARNVDPVLNAAYDNGLKTVGQDACKYWSEAQKQLLTGFHTRPLSYRTTYYFGKGFDLADGYTALRVRKLA